MGKRAKRFVVPRKTDAEECSVQWEEVASSDGTFGGEWGGGHGSVRSVDDWSFGSRGWRKRWSCGDHSDSSQWMAAGAMGGGVTQRERRPADAQLVNTHTGWMGEHRGHRKEDVCQRNKCRLVTHCEQMLCPPQMHLSLIWNHPGDDYRLSSKEQKSDCHQTSYQQPQCKKTVVQSLQTAKGMARLLLVPSLWSPRGRPTGGRVDATARV